MNALIDSPQDIYIFSLDRNYLYTAFNKNHFNDMRDVHNVTIEVGMNILDALAESDLVSTVQSSFERVLDGESCTYIQNIPSTFSWFEFNWNPIVSNDQTIIGITCFIRDITEQREMQNEIIKAKELAESATQAKSDFLANMSHEIRTPMNAIIGMGHLALKTEMTAKQHDYLSKIDKSAKALLSLINDILDFSKIEAGKLEVEAVEFNLDEVLDDLSNLMAVQSQKKGLEFIFDIDANLPLGLVGDPLRLGQVLLNLCGNAIKFTEIGEIVVSAKLIEKNKNGIMAQFCVVDTGVGLTDKQQEKLFKSFSQADSSTTRKYGGTGLGLTISKKLVELMGGEIGVESIANEGSNFRFTIQFGIHENLLKSIINYPALAADLHGERVLLVDDNETALQILEANLESFGLDVTTASSAYEALDILRGTPDGEQFPLVFMDWKMPGMDGSEATRRIKEDPKLSKVTTVIMVTAYGREEIMEQAESAGIDGFLIKPVNQSVLFNTVLEAFGKDSVEGYTPRVKNEFDQTTLAGVRGAHILLAEDNEINQQVASEILEGAGFFVDIANNGQEAVDMVQANNYDAVLMDIQMPEMDGMEATRVIREMEQFKELPIIAMTAHAMAGDREKSLKIGMQDHLTKPINPQELFIALAQWVAPGERELPEGFDTETGKVSEILTEDVDLPESMVGFNMEEGLQRIGGNKKLYRNLLLKLKRDYAKVAGTIRDLIIEGQTDEAQLLAHSVKGVAGNLGAGALQHVAEAVELKLRDGEKSLDDELTALSSEMESVQHSLSAIKEEHAPARQSGNEISSVEELIGSLEKLQPHLIKRKPKPCKDAFEVVKSLGWPSALTSDVNDLGVLISKYKFKEALPLAESILIKLAR